MRRRWSRPPRAAWATWCPRKRWKRSPTGDAKGLAAALVEILSAPELQAAGRRAQPAPGGRALPGRAWWTGWRRSIARPSTRSAPGRGRYCREPSELRSEQAGRDHDAHRRVHERRAAEPRRPDRPRAERRRPAAQAARLASVLLHRLGHGGRHAPSGWSFPTARASSISAAARALDLAVPCRERLPGGGVRPGSSQAEVARARAALRALPAASKVAEAWRPCRQESRPTRHSLFDALHHSKRQRAVLESAARRLRPRGWLLIGEPTWLHWLSPGAHGAPRPGLDRARPHPARP